MGKVGWRSGQHSVETATGTRTLIAGTEIKAMIPSSVGRAGAVVAATLTTDRRRRGLHYRDRIRRGDTPEVGRTGRLLSPVPVRSVPLTTPTAHLLWTVIVEIPFSMAAAVLATPVVRVGHFDSVPPSCLFMLLLNLPLLPQLARTLTLLYQSIGTKRKCRIHNIIECADTRNFLWFPLHVFCTADDIDTRFTTTTRRPLCSP